MNVYSNNIGRQIDSFLMMLFVLRSNAHTTIMLPVVLHCVCYIEGIFTCFVLFLTSYIKTSYCMTTKRLIAPIILSFRFLIRPNFVVFVIMHIVLIST